MHSLTFAALIRSTESEVGYATATCGGRHVAQQKEELYGVFDCICIDSIPAYQMRMTSSSRSEELGRI